MHPMVRIACIAAGLLLAGGVGRAAGPDDRGRTERLADFDAFCRFVADDYAYFDRKKTDWPAACAGARAAAADAPDRAAFVGVVERTLGELYDFHAHLGTSTPQSPRLVPTDADLYAEWRGDVATIVDVRAASGARDAGLRPGMRVIDIDGRAVADAVTDQMPKHLTAADPAARDWALRVALAGHQDRQAVRVVVEQDGVRREIAFVPHRERPDRPLTARRIGRIGVVEVHNTLGDTRLVAAFDAALDGLADAQAIVLDLRDTPSGGNTTVARGLMSRFVARESPYQKHERISEWRETGVRHVWIETVEPRGRPFTRPVAVLVGRWTGSMGEGIAIGLNAARGAPVFGAPMAGLLGALDEQRLVPRGLRGADPRGAPVARRRHPARGVQAVRVGRAGERGRRRPGTGRGRAPDVRGEGTLRAMIDLMQLDLAGIEVARGGPTTFEGLAVVDGGLPPSFILEGARDAIRAGGPPLWFGPFLFVDPRRGRIVGSGIFKGEPSDGWVEIGYGVAESVQGRGHATDAVLALVRFAFAQADVHTVYAETGISNVASRRVVQKAGFAWSGERLSEDHGQVDCWFVASSR